jgi:hypothetical protein
MSGYFRRLAQRTGLRASAPNRGAARGELTSPASSMGLEQERVVEVTQPSSAAALAPHEQTPGEATASKRRTDQHQAMQSQTSIQELHSESVAAPAALPVARDTATARDRGAERISPVVEQSVTVSASAVTATDPKFEAKPAVAPAIRSPHAAAALERHERRLVSPRVPTAPRAEPMREQSPRVAVDETSPGFAQRERESSEVEARTPSRTSSRAQFVTELFAQRASAPESTPRAPTAIDVHIGTVAVEIHQPALPPVAPPPPVLVPAPAPRPAAPRERFSPSRHYIRMD